MCKLPSYLLRIDQFNQLNKSLNVDMSFGYDFVLMFKQYTWHGLVFTVHLFDTYSHIAAAQSIQSVQTDQLLSTYD